MKPTKSACDLEAALRQAAKDPTARPRFYRQLLKSQVLVLLGGSDLPRHVAASRDVTMWLRNDGVHVVPAFTSRRAVYDAFPAGTTVGSIPMRELLKTMRGHDLHLNPASPDNCQLSAEDVIALLEHGAIHNGIQRLDVEERGMEISRAVNELPELQEALIAFFQERRQVEAAYMFDVYQRASEQRALTVCVVGDDMAALLHEIASTIYHAMPDARPIDMLLLDKSPPEVEELQMRPFYHRSWELLLRTVATRPQ